MIRSGHMKPFGLETLVRDELNKSLPPLKSTIPGVVSAALACEGGEFSFNVYVEEVNDVVCWRIRRVLSSHIHLSVKTPTEGRKPMTLPVKVLPKSQLADARAAS